MAKRNILSSIIKILVATILSFTPLGIVGVWIGYLVYGIMQKYLSKARYKKITLVNGDGDFWQHKSNKKFSFS